MKKNAASLILLMIIYAVLGGVIVSAEDMDIPLESTSIPICDPTDAPNNSSDEMIKSYPEIPSPEVQTTPALSSDEYRAEETPAISDKTLAVQAMLDALPFLDGLAEIENRESLYAQTQQAYDAYMSLTDEERTSVTGAEKFEQLFSYFNNMVAPASDVESEAYYVVSIPSAVAIDKDGGSLTIQASEIGNLTGTLRVTVSSLNDFRLVSDSGKSIAYTLKNGNGIVLNHGIAAEFAEAGKETLNFQPESTDGNGLYADTLTFTVTVNE